MVIQLDHKDKRRKLYWLCRCDCGEIVVVRGDRLRIGGTQSCGCLQREIMSICSTKHGHYKNGKQSKTYISWLHIIQRCNNPRYKQYKDYGGRGIKVCQRWRKFVNFLEDMGERPGKEYSIDRIDNDENYCKSNCRWATRKQQQRNRRDSILINYNEKTQCIPDWAEEVGIHPKTIWSRIFILNWPIEKALTISVQKRGR